MKVNSNYKKGIKRKLIASLWIYTIVSSYVTSKIYSSGLAHVYPKYEREDMTAVFSESAEELKESDYELIMRQTGLGRAAAEKLEDLSELAEFQEIYYSKIEYKCVRNSPISTEETVTEPKVRFAGIEDGDILITRSSRILSWRNGHAAIVTDASKGETLEAVVIGERSSLQSLSKWRKYPNFLVLRLKGQPPEVRKAIADAAKEYLTDMPYNAAAGMIPPKFIPLEKTEGTQCAHLVWAAYAAYGFDIDSDKGLIVTPKDISESPLLETVQSYGF